MRVLHITSGLGAGGAERSLLQLVNAAQNSADADAVEMRVASLTGADALASQFEVPPAIFDFKSGLSGALKALVAYAREFRPDVIQGWMYHGNLVASYVGWRLGAPVIWSIRHSLERPEAETRVLRLVIRLGRMACYQPKRVVYNSFSGWRTHASFGYGTKPSMIIPNGVDIHYFSPSARSDLSSSASSTTPARASGVHPATNNGCGTLPVAGCIARFHPMKGIATLLEAHAALQQTQPCELVLAGDGMCDDNAELTNLIERTGCANRVTRLGLVDDMPALYSRLSALVLPSLFGEGTPNVLLEAMASGVPVVATRVGDAPRCVGRDEWLVEPGDSAALREKLLALLTLGDAQRAALVASNAQHVATNYSLPVCHQRYGALYRELQARYPVEAPR